MVVLVLLLSAARASAQRVDTLSAAENVGVTEHRGDRLDLSLTFTDEHGEQVRLGDYFRDGKPVMLTLNYYECTSICTLQLNRLVDALDHLDVDGDQFRLVTISFDPDEGADLAREKRRAYLDLLARDDVEWHFLVGEPPAIDALTERVGFHYSYVEAYDTFAHPTAVIFLSGDGMISGYLYGGEAYVFSPRDMKFSLMDASNGEIGSIVDQLVQSCFHFVDGRYSPFAYGIMRLAGGVIALGMVIFLALMWRRERRRKAEATT